MTIDVTKPLELDNGTPVEFVHTNGLDIVKVKLPLGQSYNRHSPSGGGGSWNYYIADGRFVGGSVEDQFVLRNVVAGETVETMEARLKELAEQGKKILVEQSELEQKIEKARKAFKFSKFMAIYDGSNTKPDMTGPEIFRNQLQWNSIEDLRKRRAGTGRVISIIEFIYNGNDELIETKLHQNPVEK